MLPRALRVALARRSWSPPGGTSHVLQWSPPHLQVPTAPEGWWTLDILDDWLARVCAGVIAELEGPAALPVADLRAWVEAEFGEQVTLTPFAVDLEAGDRTENVPAYWVTVAP